LKIVNKVEDFEKKLGDLERITIQMLGSMINHRELYLEADGKLTTIMNKKTPSPCIYLNQEMIKKDNIVSYKQGTLCSKEDCVFYGKNCPFYMWYADCVHYMGIRYEKADIVKKYEKKNEKGTAKGNKQAETGVEDPEG